MVAGKRRLPEDSVVTSLSEIQSILQGERAPAAPATVEELVPPRPATSPELPLGAVPSMAEVRASREQRWREDNAPAAKPAKAAESGVPFGVWLGGALGLAAAAVVALFVWPEAEPPVVAPETAAVAPIVATAAPVSSTPAPASVATAADAEKPAVEAAPEPAKPRKRSAARTGGRRSGDSLDAVFGARTAVSRDRTFGDRKVVKKKKTRADSQFDAVLNGL